MSQLTIPDTQRLNVADALKQLLVATGAAESAEDYPANAKISFLLKALLEHYGGESEETSDRVSEIISVLAKAIEENGGSWPEGSITITENGTYDVKDYASAEVNVRAAEWTSNVQIKNKSSKWLNVYYITQNGLYNSAGISIGGSLTIPAARMYDDEDGVWITKGLFVIYGSDLKVSGIDTENSIICAQEGNHTHVLASHRGSSTINVIVRDSANVAQ